MLTDEQLQERSQGLGGSDAPAVAGVDPYRSAVQVYLEKTGQLAPDDLGDVEAVHWGNVLEDVVAQEFSRRTGLKVRRDNRCFYHDDYPELLAHIDRRVDGENAILEIKTTSHFAGQDWGEPGTDEVPARVLLQGVHYMAVLGVERVYFPVLIGGQDFRIYQADRHDRLVARLVERERAFWADHVQAQDPPDPESGADVDLIAPWDNGEALVADDTTSAALARYREARDRRLAAEKEEAVAKDELKTALGAAAYLVDPHGQTLATFKAHTQNRLDQKALERDHPEIAAQYRAEKPVRKLQPA